MVTSRNLEVDDLNLLEFSLAKDAGHSDTNVDFFCDPRTACNVYSDESGPVLFVRGAKALRLDIQYVSNDDVERNKKVMLEGFDDLAQKARENGFTEIIFNTNSRALQLFCKRHFKFEDSAGELRKFL